MSEKLVPEIEIEIDGSKISKTLLKKLLSAKISYSLEKSDMFQLTFNDADFKIQDENIFKPGKNIVIN